MRLETAATAQAEARSAELANAAARTGTCECCGKDNIEETDLVRIDSGQLLCPDCCLALKGSSVS
jgi:uncharacterized protein (UPF0212 family)